MLGIVIGVSGVIIIMSVGAGAQALVVSQIESLGSKVVGVHPGNSGKDSPPPSVMGIVITTLNYDDLQAIRNKKNVPNLVEAVGFIRGIGTASWKSNSYNTTLNGVTSGYLTVEGVELKEGRFFLKAEERNMSRNVVIGSLVKEELFGDSDAIGQKIQIRDHSFNVIGVLKEKGMVALSNADDQILIPMKTMQKLIAGVDHLAIIRVKVDNEENVKQVMEDVKYIIRAQHNIVDQTGAQDDFTVRSAAEALETITTITDSLRYFLALIAALSLVVGGIGIMNIMIVSVTERTQEIGLRKAIGASSANISNQFLIETISITSIGGLIGIILGSLISYFIYLGAQFLDYKDWEFIITLDSVALSVGVSIVVGLIFGIYPARRASKLQPVEALRYE
ncbi:ABC transporter permease [Patescibacteria group bacterium]|nr:ABC transporter permease [Patescibacteria group bacterium]